MPITLLLVALAAPTAALAHPVHVEPVHGHDPWAGVVALAAVAAAALAAAPVRRRAQCILARWGVRGGEPR